MQKRQILVRVEGWGYTVFALDIDPEEDVQSVITRIVGKYALPESNFHSRLHYHLVYEGCLLRENNPLCQQIDLDAGVPFVTLTASPECRGCRNWRGKMLEPRRPSH